MTSREEFMRQMGITTDDMNKPEEYVPPPRKERPSVIPSSGATTNSTTLRAKNSNTASASSTAAQQDYYEMKQQRQQQQQEQEPSISSSYNTPLQQKKAAPASQQSASSRAEFLRSLGIDNAKDDLPANLRGTNDDAQQSEREQRQQAAYTSASVRSALRRSEVNGEEEAHNSPSTSNYGPRGGTTTTNTTTATSASGLNTSSHTTGGIALDSSYTSNRAYNAGAGFTSSAPAPAPSSSSAAASAMRRNSSSAQSLNSSMNGSSSFTSSVPLLDIHGVEVPIDASADDLKKHGNKFYEAGDFRKAVRFYSRSIDKDPNNQVLFSNRSAAYLLASKQMALDTRTMALRDADKCIELKPGWFKGYSRRGDALFKLERFEEACDSYRAALERDPSNEAILSSLEQCKMCCGPQKDNSFAWSQPRDYHPTGRGASASLNSTSRSSMGGTQGGLDTSKSAHELLDEFRQASTRATGASVSAADYRERELARFRDQRRGGSTASSASRSNPGDNNNTMNTTTASSNGDASFTSTGGNDLNNSSSAGSKKLPDLMNSAYSSEAAANYQANLLEAYRRKKAAKQ